MKNVELPSKLNRFTCWDELINLLRNNKLVLRDTTRWEDKNDVEVINANYNGIPASPVTPLQGIVDKAGRENVIYALGCEHAENLPVFNVVPGSVLFADKDLSVAGLQASYFDNNRCEGDPVHQQIDPEVDFYWWDQAPMEDLDDDNFGVIWEGYIVPAETGRYALGGEGLLVAQRAVVGHHASGVGVPRGIRIEVRIVALDVG